MASTDFKLFSAVREGKADIARDSVSQFACYIGLVAGALYLIQLFTPLRLTSDGIDYLSFADSAIKGGGLSTLLGAHFRFPKGYAVFAFLLMKAGWFTSATMVASNLIFFAVGLAFSFRTLITLGFPRNQAVLACLLTLLSFTAVKHITQGMSDFLFFAASSCVCWLMTVRSPYRWAAMSLCTIAAIEIRFIGLALLAAPIVIAWPHVKNHRIVMAIVSIVAFLGLALGLWAGRHYLLANVELLRSHGIIRFVETAATAHSQDFAEFMLNAPFSKLPAGWNVFLLPIGAAAFLLFVKGVFAIRSRAPWLFAYLIAYTALILPWPFTDPRFWLPAMPFVFLALAEGMATVLRQIPKRSLVAAYVVTFCLLGFAALGYSTWLTFSGPRFPARYGDGLLRTAYQANCSSASADANQRALDLLRRYDWHCQ
jgi:hypothetical protein